LIIQLAGIPEPATMELLVDDQGYIGLPYIDPVLAEGLTVSELQRVIRETYINEKIYRRITVNVMLPAQSYFVRGEVRAPGRFPLTSGMTILQAIAAAGGYTEFANPKRINIIRGGETIIENARDMETNPEENLDVKAGDVIIVPRSIF
jgi:polysaccharide export outer membrane protein